MTKQSIDEAQTIEDALVRRLKRDKPNVKRKALKCIKYIAEHGSNNFRMAFQRHSQLIRDCARNFYFLFSSPHFFFFLQNI